MGANRALVSMALGIGMLVAVVHYPQSTSAELRAKLGQSVGEYELSASNLADALITTADRFKIPVGIEWVPDSETLRAIRQSWRGQTTRQVFEEIVAAYPGYEVRLEVGTLHVYRADFVDARENFLNIRVPEFFEIHHDISVVANARLLAAIRAVVSPHPEIPGTGEAWSVAGGSLTDKHLDIKTQGLTVRQVLDELVAVSERNVWIASYERATDATPTGFRRTVSVWHLSPYTNHDEPTWDLLDSVQISRLNWPQNQN